MRYKKKHYLNLNCVIESRIYFIDYGYGGFPQSPMANPAQLGSMLQQPIVQVCDPLSVASIFKPESYKCLNQVPINSQHYICCKLITLCFATSIFSDYEIQYLQL